MSLRLGLDPADERFVVGTEADRRQARAEYNRQRRLAAAIKSGMPELARADLQFGRRHICHLPSGSLYRVTLAEQFGAGYDTACAYYLTPAQEPVFLEPPAGPKTVAELERRSAEREARKAAPKPRRR